MTVFIIITPVETGDDRSKARARRARVRITHPLTVCQPRKEGT